MTSITKETMDNEITKFINQRLGAKVLDDNTLSEEQRHLIIDNMMTFVYAHRHNKDDTFILETKAANRVNFDIVRDVMYKYSKKA